MAMLIKSNGEIIENIKPDNGKKFSLKELQTYIGGYIELLSSNDHQYMVIDEEGKIKDKEYNEIATVIMEDILAPGDYIAGNALIIDCNEID